VGPIAGLAVGVAIPLVAGWYLRDFGWVGGATTIGVAVAGAVVTRWFGPTLTTVRFALLAILLLAVFRWAGL
jgi:hypothetical protein